jgi:hypothetical protein
VLLASASEHSVGVAGWALGGACCVVGCGWFGDGWRVSGRVVCVVGGAGGDCAVGGGVVSVRERGLGVIWSDPVVGYHVVCGARGRPVPGWSAQGAEPASGDGGGGVFAGRFGAVCVCGGVGRVAGSVAAVECAGAVLWQDRQNAHANLAAAQVADDEHAQRVFAEQNAAPLLTPGGPAVLPAYYSDTRWRRRRWPRRSRPGTTGSRRRRRSRLSTPRRWRSVRG